MFDPATSILPTVIGIAGICAVGLGCYWLFNKQAKKRHLEELRRIYEDMSPTDPNYNTAKALFTAAAISSTALSAYQPTGGDASADSGDGGGGGDGGGE